MHGCLGERVVVSHKPASPYFGYNARPRGKNARFRCILASQSDQLLLPHKNSLESALVRHHCDKYRSKTLLLGYPTIPRAQWLFRISTCTVGAWEWAITQTALQAPPDIARRSTTCALPPDTRDTTERIGISHGLVKRAGVLRARAQESHSAREERCALPPGSNRTQTRRVFAEEKDLCITRVSGTVAPPSSARVGGHNRRGRVSSPRERTCGWTAPRALQHHRLLP